MKYVIVLATETLRFHHHVPLVRPWASADERECNEALEKVRIELEAPDSIFDVIVED